MRVLLAIGCDNYANVKSLNSAERDAKSIYSSLVGDDEHQYSPIHSKLLLSPTSAEFRNSLSDVLYGTPNIAVFTLFFAGHGAVHDETLYLALSDVMADRIPATAIGFPEVLRSTAGARPKQANFMLDACNAGGLGFDIGSILKRTIVGDSNTIGISFVAAAAADQQAEETGLGGRFTVELTKIILGDTFVQSARPFLNLAEIAQQIQVSRTCEGQEISYWSLNLQGPSLFAKNMNYSGPSHVTDNIVSLFEQSLTKDLKMGADFRSALAKIRHGVRERSFARSLQNVLASIDPAQRAPLIYGLAEGLKIELAGANDPFLENRVYSILLGQLLGLPSNDNLRLAVGGIVEWYIEASRNALSKLSRAMTVDSNALINDPISDLYELPIRVSDIFGQCALLLLGQARPAKADSELVIDVTHKILTRYGNSVLALTDEQATGYLIFLELCRRSNWTDFSEEIIGRLYFDLHANFARVGSLSLNAEQQFNLLHDRYQTPDEKTRDFYSSPSDLVTVILSFAALAGLDSEIDFSLMEIDHTPINYFIPDTYDQFGSVGAIDGTNVTLTLGREFWRCIDLRRILRSEILPALHSAIAGVTQEGQFCVLASSLALRDRPPWHFMEQSIID